MGNMKKKKVILGDVEKEVTITEDGVRDSNWRFRTDLYRKELIDRIRSGEAEGSVSAEKHDRFGWLITRTPEQAKAYNEKYGYQVQGHWVKLQDDGTWLTKEQMLEKAA